MWLRVFLILTISSAFLYYKVIHLSSEDEKNYQELIALSSQKHSEKALEKEPALQKKGATQKDLWVDNESKHFSLKSESSQLKLCQKKDKLQAIEQMENLSCLFPGGFELRAKKGIYLFPTHQFIAKQEAHLYKEESWIKSPLIHFNFLNESAFFKKPQGFVKEEELNFQAEQLLFERPSERIHLIGKVKLKTGKDLQLFADTGTLFLNDFQAEKIHLEGNVRFLSLKEAFPPTFAVGDQLDYDLFKETLSFSSKENVLFWQENLSLKASEILMHQNGAVKGKGNVHFQFDFEEQNFIDSLLEAYL